ncbi:motility associated factor glycosyltransferase family protein, partial [bacterium]|nr:motility associated factor glycosyltransferase family protein [bacterium]
MESIRTSIEMLSCNILVGDTFILGGENRWKVNNPIQYDMLIKLYEAGIFGKLKLTPDFLANIQGYKTDYFPLVRVYGIGLGYHLTNLIKLKTISYITIYEPHIDLFFTSLYTIPWQLIFKYFNNKGKGMNLVVGGTSDAAITNNITFIRQKLMPLTSCFYRFNHFSSKFILDAISKEPQSDAIERQQSDAGWYEDQRAGFYISAKNIQKKNKFFSGKKIKRFSRAFIIGSGPSLSETINYVKKHQGNALIISCGSAITPLLKVGVIPDYEVIQERNWQYVDFEKKQDLSALKKVTLLKLNVVSTKIDKHYRETLIFQKFRDPGSSFLGDNYPVTTAVNPTVTNAGIAMCAELGINEAYLFGVDYGAPKDHEKMHVTNTIYDDLPIDDNVESTTEFDLPGNLGAEIRTTTVLSWSLQTTELKIAEHPNIRWFNVGEGAMISGAVPVDPKELPTNFSKKINKYKLREEILRCFNNDYSPAKVLERIKTTQMQQVEEYFQALKGFTASFPKTRGEVVTVLSLLYKAVNIGQNKSHFLPTPLLSYGFKQFVTNVYMQSAMA